MLRLLLQIKIIFIFQTNKSTWKLISFCVSMVQISRLSESIMASTSPQHLIIKLVRYVNLKHMANSMSALVVQGIFQLTKFKGTPMKMRKTLLKLKRHSTISHSLWSQETYNGILILPCSWESQKLEAPSPHLQCSRFSVRHYLTTV